MSDLDGTRDWVRKAPVWFVVSVVWVVGFPLCFAERIHAAFCRSMEDVCMEVSDIRRARAALKEKSGLMYQAHQATAGCEA